MLCFLVGCHHSFVIEKLGNFPDGHGDNGSLRRKEQKQTLPLVGTQVLGRVPLPGVSYWGRVTSIKKLRLSRSEDSQTKE